MTIDTPSYQANIYISQNNITDDILQKYIIIKDISKRWFYTWYPFTIQPRKNLSHYQKDIQAWPSQVIYKRVLDKQGNIKVYNGMQIVSITDKEPYTVTVYNHIKESNKEHQIKEGSPQKNKEKLDNIINSSIRYDKKDTFQDRLIKNFSTYNKIAQWVKEMLLRFLNSEKKQ